MWLEDDHVCVYVAIATFYNQRDARIDGLFTRDKRPTVKILADVLGLPPKSVRESVIELSDWGILSYEAASQTIGIPHLTAKCAAALGVDVVAGRLGFEAKGLDTRPFFSPSLAPSEVRLWAVSKLLRGVDDTEIGKWLGWGREDVLLLGDALARCGLVRMNVGNSIVVNAVHSLPQDLHIREYLLEELMHSAGSPSRGLVHGTASRRMRESDRRSRSRQVDSTNGPQA